MFFLLHVAGFECCVDAYLEHVEKEAARPALDTNYFASPKKDMPTPSGTIVENRRVSVDVKKVSIATIKCYRASIEWRVQDDERYATDVIDGNGLQSNHVSLRSVLQGYHVN